MAGSNYRLLVEAKLKTEKIQSQILEVQNKTKLVLHAGLDTADMKRVKSELTSLTKAGNQIQKVKLLEDDAGGVSKIFVQYTNGLNQVEKKTIGINKEVKATHTRYIDQARVLKEMSITDERIVKLKAKQADEMAKASLSADKWLEKSKSMQSTPAVRATSKKAEEIKVAVGKGELQKVRNLTREFDVLQESTKRSATGLRSWATGLKDSLKHTIQYSMSIGLVYGALAKLKEGVTYIADLNTEMTKIQVLQVDGAKTNEQIAGLADEYNKLGKEIGASTLEVAKGSVEWLRQGKTVDETQELLRATMYLSKLGNLEAAESTEYLTAVLNGFKMESEEAIRVVDKLVAIDNIAATSAGELATGLQYSSAVANEAGVSFESLAAMIGAVSSNTRLSAEMIGTAFRSIFVRMQQVKAGNIDETGMSLNNVEKVLGKVDIALRDSVGEFRDMEDVIADVAGIWTELNSVQRAQISNAIAGQRQAQIFTSLMQNYGDVIDYVGEELLSTGLATDRYAIYLESVEAAQGRLTASWEGLWQATIESGAITWFYNLGSAMTQAITDGGGLAPLLGKALAALILFNLELIKTKSIIAMGSISWLSTAVGVLALDLKTVGGLMVKTRSATGALTTVFGATTTAMIAGALALASVVLVLQQYNEQIREVQKQGLEDSASAWAKGIAKTSKEMKSSSELAYNYNEKLKMINETYENAEWYVKPFIDKFELISQGLIQTEKELLSNAESYDAYRFAMEQVIASSGLMIDEEGRAYREYQTSAGVKREYVEGLELVSRNQYYVAEATAFANAELLKSTEATEWANENYLSLSQTLKDLTDAQGALNDIIADAEAGNFDFDRLDELAELYPEYLDALTLEGDQLKLNTDMVREYLVEKAKLDLEAARGAGATEKEIELLEKYIETLQEQQTVMIQGSELTAQHANEVFWSIANEVQASGEAFVDLQGKALNSADAIYEFLASGDVAFNDFVRQAANATGLSTEAVANQIDAMLNHTQNNVAQTINSIIQMAQAAGASMGTMGSLLAGATAGGIGSVASVTPLGLFTPSTGGYSPSGGGGGGGSKKKTKAEKEAERLKKIQDAIKDAQDSAINSLNEQLDAYKKIIDARKDILDSLKKERDYDRSIEEHNDTILEIQNELASLQFDNSAEAEARRAQLEDELADAELALEDTQFDHSIEVQKDALDADYAKFEESIENAIKQITGITATSVEDFASQLAVILSGITPANGIAFKSGGNNPRDMTKTTFHDGGTVGGSSSGNEVFAKLIKGEQVVTEGQADKFMKNTLPQIIEGSSSSIGDINIDMPINVSGSLDKSVLPDLERLTNKVVEKINSAMYQRGFNRRTDLFST